MKERERIVITGLVFLMLLSWLGFALHRSPRFAGSLWGGVLAVSGSALMVVPFLYLLIKRVPFLKRFATRWASMRTWLTWHIYAGVIGPILVMLHTGHKFESTLGITLTAMTLIVVVSGFIGRYLMSFFAEELREKRKTLVELRKKYDALAHAIVLDPVASQRLGLVNRLKARVLNWTFAGEGSIECSAATQALRLTESIADVEYAIASHEKFKRAFGIWLKFHITISLSLYVLLGFHVWAAFHFGLRWFA